MACKRSGVRIPIAPHRSRELFESYSASSGVPGSGTAVLPCYIVSEDLIEYHWLSDPNPRVFQLGLLGSLASQLVVVKFGAPVVKGASYAHYEVKVNR